jgi:hypothetical protein
VRKPRLKRPTPRQRVTHWPLPDPSITVTHAVVTGHTAMGEVTHRQVFPPVKLQPGDTLQFSWVYDGPKLATCE